MITMEQWNVERLAELRAQAFHTGLLRLAWRDKNAAYRDSALAVSVDVARRISMFRSTHPAD